jgi:hypothetical protein
MLLLIHRSQPGVLIRDLGVSNRRFGPRVRNKSPLDELYLRVFVDSGGCSGFSYAFEISDEALEQDDVVFSGRVVKLVR